MGEIERIVDQHRRAFSGDAWHGPAVFETLKGVSHKRAATRPIAAGHTIWEIVLHIAAWEGAVRRRIEGDSTGLSDAEDWPPVRDTGEGAWKEAVALLERRHAELQSALATVPESRLAEPIPGGTGTTFYQLFHGVIQHGLYHAGQISLLKKA